MWSTIVRFYSYGRCSHVFELGYHIPGVGLNCRVLSLHGLQYAWSCRKRYSKHGTRNLLLFCIEFSMVHWRHIWRIEWIFWCIWGLLLALMSMFWTCLLRCVWTCHLDHILRGFLWHEFAWHVTETSFPVSCCCLSLPILHQPVPETLTQYPPWRFVLVYQRISESNISRTYTRQISSWNVVSSPTQAMNSESTGTSDRFCMWCLHSLYSILPCSSTAVVTCHLWMSCTL